MTNPLRFLIRSLGALTITAAMIAGLTYCTKQTTPVADASKTELSQAVTLQNVLKSAQLSCTDLIAGQNIPVGNVCVGQVSTAAGDGLQVTYTLNATGWSLSEVQLWAGTVLSAMPQTKNGNPIPGQFPYSEVFSGNSTTSYGFFILFSDLSVSPCDNVKLLVAAHATVKQTIDGKIVQSQTAWGKGKSFVTKGNWGTYFEYMLKDLIPPVITCPDNLEVQCGDTRITRPSVMATATDNCGGTVTVTFEDSGKPTVPSCSYTFTRKWTATDKSGNIDDCNQSITVKDDAAPVFAGTLSSTISCATPVFVQPTAKLECSHLDVTNSVTYANLPLNQVDANHVIYTRIYSATNPCSSAIGTYTQTVTVDYTDCGGFHNEGDKVCTSYQTETAFGGAGVGNGNAWWYYYAAGTGVQTLYAGQSINAGTVKVEGGFLTITLTDGWELDQVAEPVKIQGYDTLPSARPAVGQFDTYKGSSLSIEVPSFAFYVIHLDVRKCTKWETIN